MLGRRWDAGDLVCWGRALMLFKQLHVLTEELNGLFLQISQFPSASPYRVPGSDQGAE